MHRRDLIMLVGAAAAGWPLTLQAQQKGKLPFLGVLNPGAIDTPGTAGFYVGLRELGYTEGLNIAIERRYARLAGNLPLATERMSTEYISCR